ncbi:cupredoxin domain-containing protein [Leucobacter weissii]|uniref:Cupredoxin domain-containing protein n=1 Tax=Leucobacter weissii TaxID=1983706 RepID=A0A939S773_9MICO|nr:cupredoxin domain-containing protein [Leucobacter weissii]MBO1900686.1 cupredoxin domain-containing protein [Leucobacter weissii]
MLRAWAGLGALALLAGATGCAPAKPDPVPSDTGADPVVTIQVIDNRFEPSTVEIEAGQAVRWVFGGQADHDVVAEDGSFVSELMRSGEYVHVFDDPGEWAYDCSIHPEMTGTVVVSERG